MFQLEKMLLLLMILGSSVGQYLLSVEPQQTVLQKGGAGEISCSSLLARPHLVWSHTHVTSGATLQVSGADSRHSVRVLHTEAYVQSVLTLHNVSLEDGGLYTCKDLSQPHTLPKTVSVVVVDAAPLCDITPQTEIKEGDTVELSCQIHSTGQYRPIMQWFGPSGLVTSTHVVDTSSLNLVKTSLVFTATRNMNGDIYSCRTYFDKPHDNPLTYAFNHKFKPLAVHFSPRSLTISPLKEVYIPGDLVTCEGQGEPRPQFEWRDDRSLAKCQGATLVITKQMEGHRTYSCVATNVINGTEWHTRTSIRLYVHRVEDQSDPTPDGTTPATTTTGAQQSLCHMYASHKTILNTFLKNLNRTVLEINATKAIDPRHEERGTDNTLSYFLIIPCVGIFIAVTIVIWLVLIQCYRNRTSDQQFFVPDPHKLSTMYRRPCAESRNVCTAKPNQYCSSLKVNLQSKEEQPRKERGVYSDLVVLEDKPLVVHIPELPVFSSSCSEGTSLKVSIPDPPPLRGAEVKPLKVHILESAALPGAEPIHSRSSITSQHSVDSNANITCPVEQGGYEDEDGYLMPCMDLPPATMV